MPLIPLPPGALLPVALMEILTLILPLLILATFLYVIFRFRIRYWERNMKMSFWERHKKLDVAFKLSFGSLASIFLFFLIWGVLPFLRMGWVPAWSFAFDILILLAILILSSF